MGKKTIGDAFGGQVTTLEEQRAIWAEALHEDAIWEGPTFETPVAMIGRETARLNSGMSSTQVRQRRDTRL